MKWVTAFLILSFANTSFAVEMLQFPVSRIQHFSSSLGRELESHLRRIGERGACADLLVSSISQDLDEALDAAESTAEYIASLLPPSKFQIVGVGRSPALISAALATQYLDYVYNIPLSNFRPMFDSPSGPTLNQRIDGQNTYLSLEAEKRLYANFDKYLPQGRKTLVLLDYADSGATFLATYYYLRKYLRAKSDFRAIQVFAVTRRGSYNRVSRHLDRNLELLGYFRQRPRAEKLLIPKGLVELLNYRRLDLSQYGSYDIRKNERIYPGSYYEALCDLFRRRRP